MSGTATQVWVSHVDNMDNVHAGMEALTALDNAGGPAVMWMPPHTGCSVTATTRVEVLAEELAKAASSEHLVLNAAELRDKWGFEDGDMLSDAVQVWRSHVQWPQADEFGGWPYINDRHLLWNLVCQYLMPAIEVPETELTWVGGVHNPVRCEAARRGSVQVSWAEVAQAANEMFVPRSLGWLSLHGAVCAWVCGYTVPGSKRKQVIAHTDAVYEVLGETASLVAAKLRRADLAGSWVEIAQAAQACAAPAGGADHPN